MAAEIPTKPIPAPAPHARTKPQPAIARFEALVKEAKISQKGETVVTLTIPWENREDGVNLALQQGIMLDFRVTRKRRG